MNKIDKIVIGVCLGSIAIGLLQRVLVRSGEEKDSSSEPSLIPTSTNGEALVEWVSGSMASYVTVHHEPEKARTYKEYSKDKHTSISNRLYGTEPVRLELLPEFDDFEYREMLKDHMRAIEGTNETAVARRKQLEELIKSGKIAL